MNIVPSKDGTQIAYDVLGKGPVLIFITGATCFRSFEPVIHDASTFAQQFTVYNYDRRGRGDSSNTLPYSIEKEIDDLEALIDEAGGDVHLYGHSSGAIIALEAAIRLDNKINKVVLYDPPYVEDEAAKKEFNQLKEQLNELLEQKKYAEALAFFLEGIGIPREVIDGMFRQSPQWNSMLKIAPTLAYDTMLASDLAPLKKASKVTVPVQIIVGKENPKNMQEVAKQLSEAIPNAKLIELEGQNHMPDPKLVLQIMSSFLKAHR
ncbi:alpha/beta fold hydrolase [Gracilibacillus dipsosauri]|uniref:alpha/beta fold hydrolase n=1 Tax=Gracilibacillus dipsosauri TaxID=178340 RepID=UPI00240A54E9